MRSKDSSSARFTSPACVISTAGSVTRHPATRAGEPFHRRGRPRPRRLDEFRLFSSVTIRPELESGRGRVAVAVTETPAACRPSYPGHR